MECNICQSASQRIFSAVVLGKYPIQYYQCSNCQFIQTEEPFWLSEAYESAITSLDIGLVRRNLIFSDKVDELLIKYFNYKSKFLDYAGGYGLFVRLMRDRGFDFYRQDPFCENIFAKFLDVENLEADTRFELVTAFEVFEHWKNPLEEFQSALNYSDSVLFSTVIQPDETFSSPDDWWYFMPETGQHVAFYSTKSLEILANNFELNFYSNGTDLHLFTKKKFEIDPLKADSSEIGKLSLWQRMCNRVLQLNKKQSVMPSVTRPNLFAKDIEAAQTRLKESRVVF